MPLLITLKTDLKSLKYGHDRPGGGNSGEPFVQNDINNPKDILGSIDDGFIRGGAVGAFNSSRNDSIRIGKWLKSSPKGLLWITKQFLLQASNPKLETKANNFFSSSVIGQPTRFYNLGINTLAQVAANASGIHFNRHGVLPVQDNNTKYLSVAQANNQNFGANNRLVKLKDQFIFSLSGGLISRSSAARFQSIRSGNLRDLFTSTTLFSYPGGPESVYGVGNTRIKRYDITTEGSTNFNVIPAAPEYYSNSAAITNTIKNYEYLTPISKAYGEDTKPNKSSIDQNTIADRFKHFNNYRNPGLVRATDSNLVYTATEDIPPNITVAEKNARKYQIIRNIVNDKSGDSGVAWKDSTYTEAAITNKFRLYDSEDIQNIANSLNTRDPHRHNAGGGSFFYISENEEVAYQGPYVILLNDTWNKLDREVAHASPWAPEAEEKGLMNITDPLTADMVIFTIEAIGGKKMQFRSYITQFSDGIDAKWNPTQYVGRGEEFYTYNGHTRKIQIGFKVALLGVGELIPTYQKLNYLMSNLMPEYVNGLMRGPMVKITVGSWIYDQTGIINSLNYTIPNESPWEIELGKSSWQANNPAATIDLQQYESSLPHVVDVTLGFTPIGVYDNKLAQRGINTYPINGVKSY